MQKSRWMPAALLCCALTLGSLWGAEAQQPPASPAAPTPQVSARLQGSWSISALGADLQQAHVLPSIEISFQGDKVTITYPRSPANSVEASFTFRQTAAGLELYLSSALDKNEPSLLLVGDTLRYGADGPHVVWFKKTLPPSATPR